jgi:hypothetical protein
MRRVTVLIVALLIAGCGGGETESAAVPDGFKTLAGDGWTLAYPAGWEVSQVEGSRLAQGPKGEGGLAPQAAVARDAKPPPFELDGADQARVIEAGYIERTTGGTTPVRTIDLLVRTQDGDQLDFLMRAPSADFDRVRLNEVLDTIRLT